jgi:Putative Ig domain
MDRAANFSWAPLRAVLVRTCAVIVMAGAALAHAAGDGLAISGTPPSSATVGKAYSFTPTVTNPAKKTLAFTIVNKPSWAAFSATSGSLTGTPAAANVGTQSDILIRVTDGVSTATSAEFHITTSASSGGTGTGGGGGGGAPTISGSPAMSATVGKSYSFTPSASGSGLTFSIVNKPSWAAFSATTGSLTGTPAAANVGTQSDILMRATNSKGSASLPEFHITVSASTSTADVPVISGSPGTSVVAGSAYKFQPTAKDPDGKTLSFSVQNKPSWATFSISSGLLNGTPTTAQEGSYSNIVISASNGTSSAALPAFSVKVNAPGSTPPPATGSATIDWVPPTKNTNGSPLTDLAGVKIYYGTSAANLSKVVQVASSTQTSTTISNLAAGTWYFGGVSYTTTGAQSTMSTVVSLNIP